MKERIEREKERDELAKERQKYVLLFIQFFCYDKFILINKDLLFHPIAGNVFIKNKTVCLLFLACDYLLEYSIVHGVTRASCFSAPFQQKHTDRMCSFIG